MPEADTLSKDMLDQKEKGEQGKELTSKVENTVAYLCCQIQCSANNSSFIMCEFTTFTSLNLEKWSVIITMLSHLLR